MKMMVVYFRAFQWHFRPLTGAYCSYVRDGNTFLLPNLLFYRHRIYYLYKFWCERSAFYVHKNMGLVHVNCVLPVTRYVSEAYTLYRPEVWRYQYSVGSPQVRYLQTLIFKSRLLKNASTFATPQVENRGSSVTERTSNNSWALLKLWNPKKSAQGKIKARTPDSTMIYWWVSCYNH